MCPVCHANLDLVGRVHRCAPLPTVDRSKATVTDEDRLEMARLAANPLKVPEKKTGSTYRSRDKESRKKYMREYMMKKKRSQTAKPKQSK